MNFDYQGAKDAGYSDEEITSHLSEMNPKFDVKAAREAGYSPAEINEHLISYKPKKSLLEKGGRIAGQFALGAAEGAAFPVTAPFMAEDSKSLQKARSREDIASEIEYLYEKKATGEWTPEDEAKLNEFTDIYQSPEKLEEITHEPIDVSVRGIVEKSTGLDLQPEGVLEHAANWAGFLKNPKNIADLARKGIKSKDVLKAVLPSGTDVLRGLGAGTALEIAKDGNYGPIGTMGAAIVGDLIGGGASGIAKGVKKLATAPKKTLAEATHKVTSFFSPKEKLEVQKQLIKDFEEAGLTLDAGTLTDNNFIKMLQARVAQSGLTGQAAKDFRKELTQQFEREYKKLADNLGEAKYAINHEAGTAIREGIKTIRDADLAETRTLYENANKSLKENAYVDSRKLNETIERIEKDLKPGALKSTEQQTVLNRLKELKQDIRDSEGNWIYANVKDLMNNKIALNDIINYEVQGGTKQLLKGVVAELDRAIISHGKENPRFAKNYINANKRFSQHAKTFRNKPIDQILRSTDPDKIMNKMNSIQGIRDIRNILYKTPEGKKIFNDLRRLKLDQVIGNNLVDSTSQQIKLGTFSKLLEKGKNREIFKELLSPSEFKTLEKLQKNAGKLADTAQQFFNASQSGVLVADAAIVAKGLNDVGHLLYGNPWPIAKTAGSILAARQISNLLFDGEFLKLLEQVVKDSGKMDQQKLINYYELLKPYFMMMMTSS